MPRSICLGDSQFGTPLDRESFLDPVVVSFESGSIGLWPVRRRKRRIRTGGTPMLHMSEPLPSILPPLFLQAESRMMAARNDD